MDKRTLFSVMYTVTSLSRHINKSYYNCITFQCQMSMLQWKWYSDNNDHRAKRIWKWFCGSGCDNEWAADHSFAIYQIENLWFSYPLDSIIFTLILTYILIRNWILRYNYRPQVFNLPQHSWYARLSFSSDYCFSY